MACPHKKPCPLHAQLGGRATLTVWQTLYCESGFDRCARYRLSFLGLGVPPDLMPDGRTVRPVDPARC